ncbi:uncharacterized protein THITE_2112180 [Thermothielavioides terrestris NRRL 8126]|uniref:Uncharacterized protein n=1 Tax=Thermothielavioides terrestris (strain ATCC 38088 / NRRL 8126) TaxID=578455 RepID=G2R537_THETT|nr:uncharacterized protein THITE_2112180 [Thermothielavioides terrestris NRRL 8126]AEO65314.1 hypothetical protein THITE_2112180 [Thermothielavioides terrestris NRRL 8126]
MGEERVLGVEKSFESGCARTDEEVRHEKRKRKRKQKQTMGREEEEHAVGVEKGSRPGCGKTEEEFRHEKRRRKWERKWKQKEEEEEEAERAAAHAHERGKGNGELPDMGRNDFVYLLQPPWERPSSEHMQTRAPNSCTCTHLA